MQRECSGHDIRDVPLQRKTKITSLHSYLKRSMPETLFGTLTNLLYSVQKHLSARTLNKNQSNDVQCKTVGWFPNRPHS